MKTVLLLDDDEDLRALLSTTLIAQGVNVIEVATCREAETAIEKVAVDVIVVDGLLSDGSGLEFIERLRGRDGKQRVVFLSAAYRDLRTFRHLTHDLDVQLVLYKPIDPVAFTERVLELLSPRPGAAAPPPADLSAFAAHLVGLEREFRARLPEKLAELEAALRQAREDPAEIQAARTLAHRLRGSAGSYGFASVGVAAGLVEDLLAEAAPTLPGNTWERLDGALIEARQVIERPPSMLPPSPNATGVQGKALLVVDDDQDFLRLVRAIARALFVEVVTAEAAEDAIQLARSQPLLGAILDVHLEEEQSFELAKRIRETDGNEDISVAFISGDRRIETRVAAIEAGGSRFFEKPIAEEAFGESLRQFLRISQAQQGRVLIVDDDPDVLEHYSRHLRFAGLTVEQLLSADTLVERLEEMRPDVLLLDVNLPRVSGIDVCRALRRSERWELLPILVVTSRTDPETRLAAFRAGASDVIPKPVIPEELLARVRVQEERVRMHRERADRDALSGLLLRRAFLEAFQRSLAGCVRRKQPLSLVLFDIDKFKSINDTYGHLAGDQVIARLGELLRRRFRIEDLRGRWAGEEFVLAFPGATPEFALEATERLLAEFAQLEFAADDRRFHATFTAGIASYPDNGTSISALIRHADQLLYEGKRTGRNRAVSASGEMPAAAARARR